MVFGEGPGEQCGTSAGQAPLQQLWLHNADPGAEAQAALGRLHVTLVHDL